MTNDRVAEALSNLADAIGELGLKACGIEMGRDACVGRLRLNWRNYTTGDRRAVIRLGRDADVVAIVSALLEDLAQRRCRQCQLFRVASNFKACQESEFELSLC